MSEKLRVFGGNKLKGRVQIAGSKNALLPILAGSILADDFVLLKNVPDLTDLHKMCDILSSLGAEIKFDKKYILIKTKKIDKFLVSNELGKDIRGSIVMLGALLSKFKYAVISSPGGCRIGQRPIQLHTENLKKLGVKITEQHGYLFCDAKNMKAGTIIFEKQSVGATQNLMLASVYLKGKTTLMNCAKEPEIVDLANFLNAMGAKIRGAGTSKITIYGVDKLNSVEYSPIADRIVAGTYLVAGAMTGGNVEICGINPDHILSIIKKLTICGCNIDVKNDRIKLSANKPLKSLRSLTTGTFPKFPTDMQSQFLSLMCITNGRCTIVENLFDGRFNQVQDLIKMGANIHVFCNRATVKGVEKLSGADVVAPDLRAGAGLVLAGLVAEGYTTIDNVELIDRGYAHIEDDLKSLGADIKRM